MIHPSLHGYVPSWKAAPTHAASANVMRLFDSHYSKGDVCPQHAETGMAEAVAITST